MTSLHQLSRQWSGMQSIFAQLIAGLSPGVSICSSSEFAAAAWQHKLRKWHTELDDLIEEYPVAVSISELEASHRQLKETAPTMAFVRHSG